MKKVFSMVAVCCLAMMSFVFTGCETDVMGDQVYYIGTSDDTSTGSYTSYKFSGAEKHICDAMEAISTPLDTSSPTYKLNGARKKMDKKVKAAVNQAMDEINNDSTYWGLFDISETTVEVTRISGDGKEVVLSRKFEKKCN